MHYACIFSPIIWIKSSIEGSTALAKEVQPLRYVRQKEQLFCTQQKKHWWRRIWKIPPSWPDPALVIFVLLREICNSDHRIAKSCHSLSSAWQIGQVASHPSTCHTGRMVSATKPSSTSLLLVFWKHLVWWWYDDFLWLLCMKKYATFIFQVPQGSSFHCMWLHTMASFVMRTLLWFSPENIYFILYTCPVMCPSLLVHHIQFWYKKSHVRLIEHTWW